ncbi:MAG: tetratricopeptide repeat protein [Cyanobacteria bacterium HKST-UBA02]|nr:tetratricopeptide repeat protein [Cyanobacteria bacterium HKST-UBA02]
MKIALLTVFASMALGWLASAGGLNLYSALFFIPLYFIAMVVLEGLSYRCSRGSAVCEVDSVSIMGSWRLLTVTAACLLVAYLVPTVTFFQLGPSTSTCLATVILSFLVQVLISVAAINRGYLSPRLLIGHLLIFSVGMLTSAALLYCHFWNTYWGDHRPLLDTLWASGNRGVSDAINVLICIGLTAPLLAFLEVLNFRMVGRSARSLGLAIASTFMIVGLLLILLPAYLSWSSGVRFASESFANDASAECFRFCVALMTVPLSSAGVIVACLRWSKRGATILVSSISVFVLAVGCTAWMFRYQVCGYGLMLMGRYEAAIHCFSEAIESDTRAAWAYAARGRALDIICLPARALPDLEKATMLEPENRDHSDHLMGLKCRLRGSK